MARRSDHTREELHDLTLKTAVKIVENEGFNALTARRIAKDIGYTPGTIYNVFGSMNGLYFEINAVTLKRLQAGIMNQNADADPEKITQNVIAMAHTYLKFAQENKNLWLMAFNQPLSKDAVAPDWYRDLVTEQFTPLEKLLDPLFSPSREKETQQAARALWAGVHGICIMKETEKMSLFSKGDAFEIIEYMIDNLIAGIKSA